MDLSQSARPARPATALTSLAIRRALRFAQGQFQVRGKILQAAPGLARQAAAWRTWLESLQPHLARTAQLMQARLATLTALHPLEEMADVPSLSLRDR